MLHPAVRVPRRTPRTRRYIFQTRINPLPSQWETFCQWHSWFYAAAWRCYSWSSSSLSESSSALSSQSCWSDRHVPKRQSQWDRFWPQAGKGSQPRSWYIQRPKLKHSSALHLNLKDKGQSFEDNIVHILVLKKLQLSFFFSACFWNIFWQSDGAPIWRKWKK